MRPLKARRPSEPLQKITRSSNQYVTLTKLERNCLNWKNLGPAFVEQRLMFPRRSLCFRSALLCNCAVCKIFCPLRLMVSTCAQGESSGLVFFSSGVFSSPQTQDSQDCAGSQTFHLASRTMKFHPAAQGCLSP